MSSQLLNRVQKLLHGKDAKDECRVCRVVCSPTRFKIMMALKGDKKGLTVTQLSKKLRTSLSRTSHQLRILKREEVISSMKAGREAIYKLGSHRPRKRPR